MTSQVQPPLSTHWFLPAWWVRAFEAAALAEADGASAMRHAVRAGLAPALAPIEMNALAAVLATLQEQVLAGRHGRLELVVEEHLKHAGTAARARRLSFERVLQGLTGLRLLASPSVRLFAGDQWRLDQQGDVTAVELQPSRLGPELILGVADAHLDLVRLAAGEDEARAALGAGGPLILTRSLWLDLAGVDQLLLLRLERAMQWQCRWLQLEGVCGVPVRELFDAIRLEAKAAGGGQLAERLRALARLGKKLAAHGLLQSTQADCYLAVAESEEQELSLVWQLTRERLASEAGTAYTRAAAAFMRQVRYGDHLEPFFRVVSPAAPSDAQLARARELWTALTGAGDAAPAHLSTLDFGPGELLSPTALFVELVCRSKAGMSDWPVPEAVRASALWQPVEAAARGGADVEAFQAFAAVLDETPRLAALFRELPYATLASPATRRDATFATRVKGLLAPGPAASLAGVGVARVTPGTTPSRVEGAAADDAARAAPRKAAVSGALASRMLRTASEELARMRAASPDRYGALQRSYLGSLDDVGRRLMLDVQRRMQPSLFEKHLHQRLVRYMVDNPGAWRSEGPSGRPASS